MDETLILIAALVIAYILVYIYIKRNKAVQDKGLTPYGPAILIKTRLGIRLMKRLSGYKRFWSAYGVVSKFIVLGLMVFMTGLLVYQITLVPSIPRENALGVEYVIGLPGINPVIPVVYGIIALIICLVIHEFSHGVQTLANDMDVDSTGLMFIVIPIGAFVEPNNEQIIATTKKKRTTMYAAGAATNFIFAVVFLTILSSVLLGGVSSSYEDQPMIVSVSDGSPADMADFEMGCIITKVGLNTVEEITDLYSAPDVLPGSNVTMEYVYKGTSYSTNVTSGVFVESVSNGSPAEDIGITSGMLIYSVNGTEIRNLTQFSELMESTRPGQDMSLTVMRYDDDSSSWVNVTEISTITLTSGSTDKGYMGITMSYAGLGVLSPNLLLATISNPYSSTESVSDFFVDTLRYLALPFNGLSPLPSELTWVFDTGSVLSEDAFWFLVNSCYWIFWMNFMLATTNSLPAVPLDGGYLFMDWMDSLVAKLKKGYTDEQREKAISTITGWLSMFVLFAIIFMLVGPYLF